MDILSCGNRSPPPFRVEPGHRRIVQRCQARVASAPFLTDRPSDRHQFGTAIAITLEW